MIAQVTKAFMGHTENDNMLTKPQEELLETLETIENVLLPFGGISILKDLR